MTLAHLERARERAPGGVVSSSIVFAVGFRVGVGAPLMRRGSVHCKMLLYVIRRYFRRLVCINHIAAF